MLYPILALDTASEYLIVGLRTEEGDWGFEGHAPNLHAEWCLPLLEQLLNAACITSVCHLRYLGYGRGPGSFTGIRIGASIIQGLAIAYGKPVVPCDSRLIATGAHGRTKSSLLLDEVVASIHRQEISSPEKIDLRYE